MRSEKKGVHKKRVFGRLIFLSLLLFLFSIYITNLVIADAHISGSNFPTITLEFGEQVTSESALICCEDESQNFCNNGCDSSNPDIFANITDGSITITITEYGKSIDYKVNNNLLNGNYKLLTNVSDLLGNEGHFEVSFAVNYSTMPIYILEPYQGCSNSSYFDVIIQSQNESNCWYNYEDSSQFDSSLFDLEPEYDYRFITPDGIIHSKINFSQEHNLQDLPPDVVSMYVTCNRTYDKSKHFKHFNLLWDSSLPLINYSFDDGVNELVEDPSAKFFELFAYTTDDLIGCQMQTLINDGQVVSNPEFVDIDEDVNITDPWTYEQMNYRLLNFSDINDFNPHHYLYNISCRNRAQLYDNPKLLNLTVSLNKEFTITKIKPDAYVSSPIDFVFKTSILTEECAKDKPGGGTITLYGNTSGGQIYSFEDYSYPEGEHNEIITCKSSDYTERLDYTFTVDSTAPENLSLNLDNQTCSLTNVDFSVTADDSLSGIDYYNYTLSNSDSIIEQGIADENEADDVDIDTDLDENASYTLKVWAYDRAGNSAGPVEGTIEATSSDSLGCDSSSPDIIFDKVEEIGVTYLNISCIDSNGCQDLYYYDLLSNITEDCNYSSEGSFSDSTTHVLTEDKKVCVKVYDNNNNEEIRVEILHIQYSDHCSNDVQDEDETDVDCGGSCPDCDINSSCVNDSDCSSGWCDNGTCQSATCEDGIQNQQESDVDCGGLNCPDCDINSSCVNDSDCSSAWCEDGICHTSSCNDSIENGFESDVDCGGPDCSPCPNGFKCEEDSDCESGNCDLLYGECAGQGQQDSDEDGMPDDWEDMYGLDKNDPSDAEEDKDDDGFTNLEEYLNGTDPTVSDKKSSAIPLILLILGILLVAGGTGYLIYYTKTKKKLSPESEPTLNKPKKVQKPKISKEKLRELKKKREMMAKRFKSKMKKNKSELSSKLSPFDEFNSEVEEEVKKKIGKEALAQKKKEELEEKETPKKSVRLDEGIDKEYLEVSDLEKSAKKQKAKSRKEGGIGSSVFEKLKDIEESKEEEKSDKKKVKKEDKKVETKQYVTKEEFDKLDKLIEEEKVKIEKEKKEKSEEKTDKKSEEKPDKKKEEDKKESEDIIMPKEDEDIREKAEDIFAELEDIANKKHVNKDKKDILGDSKVDSEDLIDMFKDKEININVFKVILSELLKTKKLSKNDVSNIIFKLLEQDLVKKDVANKVLDELDLINK